MEAAISPGVPAAAIPSDLESATLGRALGLRLAARRKVDLVAKDMLLAAGKQERR
jgi:hypothetical protein